MQYWHAPGKVTDWKAQESRGSQADLHIDHKQGNPHFDLSTVTFSTVGQLEKIPTGFSENKI